MVNIYESVDNNKRRSAIVVAGFVLFIFLAAFLISKGIGAYYGYQTTGFEFAGIAMIVSGVMSFASYYWSDKIILTMSQAHPADKHNYYQFYTVTENLCLGTGLPMPKLYVIDDTAMNAFATGRDPAHAAICATSGLLDTLNRTELEGVIGHELSHVANYDTRLMAIVTILVGLVTLLGDWFMRATWFGRGRRNNSEEGEAGAIFIILGLLFAITSPIIAQIIQLAISRRREYLADASSVKITRQPSGLISALQKLDADREPLEAANKATAHLYIVNPFKGIHGKLDLFSNLFNTHPPIADRIAALQAMS
jgi:heat shock protein HtpX